MLKFKRLHYKNFLSAGEQGIEICFTDCASTLIIGSNGAGKSSLIDALVFALFGKPYRKINKPLLSNSINEKGLMVTLEFERGNDQYVIRRGMHPSIFEIEKNGKPLNHNASVKDFQKDFESNHLGMTYRSFCQIVVIGSSSYIPFMKLSPHERRKVIEDLLDIDVLAKMSDILKIKKSTLKSKADSIQTDKVILDSEISNIKRTIASIREKDQELIDSLREEITACETKIEDYKQKEIAQAKKVERIQETLNERMHEVSRERDNIVNEITTRKNTIREFERRSKFIRENDECPTCMGRIEDDQRESVVSTSTSEITAAEKRIADIQEELSKVEAEKTKFQKLNELLNRERNKLSTLRADIKNETSNKQKAEMSIQSALDSLTNDGSSEDDLREKERKLGEILKSQKSLSVMDDHLNSCRDILKDTGVRAKILSHYIPILNERVNHYLEVLDFFASFKLDENFNETIRARHVDEFSYDSFSEGEKQRVSLALLFAWRDLARMKNSLATNLLILDETFDSSLDAEGVENLMMIFSSFDPSTNVHVISHKVDLLDDRFEQTLIFSKKGNFSEISKK